MRNNIKTLINIILFSILLLTSSKAELKNKVIISLGNQIITNYDLDREKIYLNIITTGRIKNLGEQKLRKIAVESLIKDKIKTDALERYRNIIIKDEAIDDQINQSAQKFGFNSPDDFKSYLLYEKYTLDEFKKKILLEIKWNQLVYQFYKNQIVIDKEKIDKKLKKLISEQKKKREYLIYEIFLDSTKIKTINEENEKKVEKEDKIKIEKENKKIEKKDEIIVKTEIISYDNKKNISVKEEVEEEIVEEIVEEKINPDEEKRITVNELLKNIEERGFESVAIEYSSSSTSELGGKLGWIDEKEFSKKLLKFIQNTEVGKVSQPISVPGGLLFLKIADIKITEPEIDLDKKMKELVEIEKNTQLTQFSTNYFNQVKNNIKINYFDD